MVYTQEVYKVVNDISIVCTYVRTYIHVCGACEVLLKVMVVATKLHVAALCEQLSTVAVLYTHPSTNAVPCTKP